jgi:glycosyltransferase involved in cell wall biosynthesis
MQQNKMQPMISVLMGIYYRREDTGLLHRSIRSILAQTYSNLEMIICDDGSTEAAQKVIQQYAGKDPRIHLVRNGNLITLPQKLNACLHQAKGEFLARMDDDDYARVDRLDKQMDFLLRHPNVSFVGSNVNLYCGGKAVGIRKLPENPVIQDFLLVQPFVHPTLLFRREALLAVGIRRINTACCARIMIYCFVCMSTAIGGQICRNGSLTIPSLKRQKEVGECPIGGMNQ